MTEETKKTNTCGLIGMIFSIIGLVFCITIIFTFIGRFCLFIGFILGLIGLFSKPRGKAVAAIIIPLFVICSYIGIGLYIRNNIKEPIDEFTPRFEGLLTEENEDMLNNKNFQKLSEEICKKELEDDNIEEAINNSKGDSTITKFIYYILEKSQKCIDKSIEEYKNIQSDEDNETNEEIVNETQNEEIEEVKIENLPEQENPAPTFSAEELQDIEDFLDILE